MDEQRIKEIQKSLSRRLTQCREAMDVSQEQLAARIGRNVKVIQNLEQGDREQSVIALLHCARALEISLSDLLELALKDNELLILTATSTDYSSER